MLSSNGNILRIATLHSNTCHSIPYINYGQCRSASACQCYTDHWFSAFSVTEIVGAPSVSVFQCALHWSHPCSTEHWHRCHQCSLSVSVGDVSGQCTDTAHPYYHYNNVTLKNIVKYVHINLLVISCAYMYILAWMI
jgi:hypothetical protein